MDVLFYLTIISLGAFIGYKELFSKKLSMKLAKIQNICLLFLLFLMGVKIGINEEILKSFPTLGFSAILISLFSIIFSVLFVRLISKYISNSGKES